MIKGGPASVGVKILQKTSICWFGNGFVILCVISKEKEIRKASVIKNIIDEEDKQHGPKYILPCRTRDNTCRAQSTGDLYKQCENGWRDNI